MAATDDERTQKLGMILALITNGNEQPVNFEILKKTRLLLLALPVRFAAVHFLHESLIQARALNLIIFFLPVRDRARYRSHVGKSILSARI
jgi:hypothetical protein